MSWPQYQSKYRQFLISVHQAQLTTLAAGAALESFPRNLPEPISVGLSDALRTASQLLDTAIARYESQDNKRVQVTTEIADHTNPVFLPMLHMYALVVKEGQSPDSVDFQSALYRQQLVMIVAHAEAFFGDSLRFICVAQPKLLESDQKQIPWSTALAFPDRDALRAALSDSFVAAMMQSKDIAGLLTQLRGVMGLDISVDSDRTKQLSLAEQVRHIIVHNGGRVDRKFLERTLADIPIGELYPVDKAFVDVATAASLAVGQSLFIAISKKYFSISDPIAGVGWKLEFDSGDAGSR